MGFASIPVLRVLFLIAGLLLLSSVFHNARRIEGNNVSRKVFVALGSHRASPTSTEYKRCDVDGSCVIVTANWGVAADVCEIAAQFGALPEKLSFAHLSTLSLRGPPPPVS